MKSVPEKIDDAYKAFIQQINLPKFSECFGNKNFSQEEVEQIESCFTYSSRRVEITSEINKARELYNKLKNKNLSKEEVKDYCDRFNPDVHSYFYDPQLIEKIWRLIDKKHKLDHKEKIAAFLVALTAELPNPSDRVSTALKGDSSAGKDNIIKTVFELFPENDNFFLTRGTSSALEEKCNKVKRIAFSEINKHREGANSELTETFKQMAEGGVSVLKQDVMKGFKGTIHIKREQKSLFYGTTEAETDDELETRFVVIPVKGYPYKNQIVVNDVLDKVSEPVNIIFSDNKNNWVAKSIGALDNEIHVVIPFGKYLKEKIVDEDGKEKYLFDFAKERIKRDAKRLLALTKAVAWLHQKQRTFKTIDDKKYIIAEPTDFLFVLRIFSDFFNLTYTGLDHRYQKTLDCIKANVGQHTGKIADCGYEWDKYHDWVIRSEVQRELGIESRTTIKKHTAKLSELSFIETYYDEKISNQMVLLYPVTSPITPLSLPVTLTAIDRYLTGCITGSKLYNKKLIPIDTLFIGSNTVGNSKHGSEKMTGSELTGQKVGTTYTDSDNVINYIADNQPDITEEYVK